MELFVINRHEGNESEGIQEERQEIEKTNLDKVLKRIERNKQLRSKQKELQSKKKLAIQKTFESREIRRQLKAKIIPVPENVEDEFIDKTLLEEIKKDSGEVESKEELKTAKKSSKKSKINDNFEGLLEGFTVLGSDNIQKKKKVKRVLPKWLANPTVISVNLQNLKTKASSVKQLDKGIRKLLKSNGIRYFFPVQAEVIPWLIDANRRADVMFPQDICVSAPTGSGKTLAFVLPIIQALLKHTVKRISALVILPTQDLAHQVYKTFKTYSQNTNIDICLITGNHPFAVEQKQLVIKNVAFGILSKVDILVCTPGRLVDHIKMTEGFSLVDLEFLVIDEADRVLENIQNDWLYHLEKHIYQDDPPSKILNVFTLQGKRPPQKLLFSATLSQDPEKLQQLSLFQPKLFTSVVEDTEDIKPDIQQINTETFIGKYTTPRELSEKYVITSSDLKPLYLYKFIKLEKLTRSIVFTHSAETAHRLAILMRSLFKEELKVEELSSNLQGKSRSQLIEKFSNGAIDVLVSTDALARGIDLPNVQSVISYSAPKYLKTYIHRAGRTARAGEQGLAVTLLLKGQLPKFKSMLQQANKSNVEEVTILEDDLEPLGEQYTQSLQDLKKVVEKEEKMDLEKNMLAKGKNRKRKRKNSNSSTKKE